jgi:hypothetical protein
MTEYYGIGSSINVILKKKMKVLKNCSEGYDIYHEDIMCGKDFTHVGTDHTQSSRNMVSVWISEIFYGKLF